MPPVMMNCRDQKKNELPNFRLRHCLNCPSRFNKPFLKPQTDESCDKPADCPSDQSCVATLDAAGTGLLGWCSPDVGSLGLGYACQEDSPGSNYSEDCESVFCLESMCSEVCSQNADCGAGQGCMDYSFCLAEPCSNPDNMSYIPMCVVDKSCTKPSECITGEACVVYPLVANLVGWCLPDFGDLALGATCDETYSGVDPSQSCEGFYCLSDGAGGVAQCSEVCAVALDCAVGQTCVEMEFCLQEPCDQPANVDSIAMCLAQ